MSAKKYDSVLKNTLKRQFEILSEKYNITGKDKDDFLSSFKCKKSIRKKTILTYEQKCKARKQDGTQCSRRHKPNEKFCGKHIHKQKYGIYQLKGTVNTNTKNLNMENMKNMKNIEHYMKSVNDTSKQDKTPTRKTGKRGRKPKQTSKDEKAQEFLTLRSIQIQNKYYYIDKFNILYNPEPINGQYEVIGKLKDIESSEVFYATSLY